jgi:hypothetical protein
VRVSTISPYLMSVSGNILAEDYRIRLIIGHR